MGWGIHWRNVKQRLDLKSYFIFLGRQNMHTKIIINDMTMYYKGLKAKHNKVHYQNREQGETWMK